MNSTQKSKTATETLIQSEMGGDITFLHRFRWGLDGHPKLHALLSEMYDSDEPPSAPAPVIEILFKDRKFYILPEYAADFTLRLYSDYLHRRPPFTQKRLDALRSAMENSPETIRALEQILSGGDAPETIPEKPKED